MPFNEADIYTSSGSVQLFNEWVPYVSKFDTSSFYNWEQDNLPLYDLEERTYELWEQNGYNTSAGVPGLALTVSADAANTPEGQAALLANRNIFTEVSSCIAAIPKVVRFPVLVEVASFGDIGDLELHNFRIEEGGSIEIINRNFARAYDASSGVVSVISAPARQGLHALPNSFSSIDTRNAFNDASCVHLETPVLSATNDARANGNHNVAIYSRHSLRRGAMYAGIGVGTSFTGNTFSVEPYEEVADISFDNTLGTLDITPTRQSNGGSVFRSGYLTPGDSLGGNIYLNTLGKISVKNCDGPIYIRNFFVDGAKDTTNVTDNGIEVLNSKVVLENCTAVRCNKAGFKFNSADVTLSRSAFSYRNYTLESTSVRTAQTGFGFHAVNSDVTLSSVPLGLDFTSIGDNGASGADCKLISSRNYAGFVLENSKLTGGVQRSVANEANRGSVVASELNTGYGFILNNSKVDLDGLVDLYGNDKGIEADNSKFVFENLCVEAHTNEGIRARNSVFLFDSIENPTAAGQADRHQVEFFENGQHLDLQSNSSFGFRRKNSIPQKYGNTKFQDSHGVITWDGANKSTLPAISVDGGSTLDLVHPNIRADRVIDNIENVPSFGRALRVVNNSKASLFGSKTGATFVFGPAGYTYQQKMAGLFAQNNSVINLHGPTAMGQFGVDVLVENNSVLNIEPARKRDSFALEVSGFDLSSGENHTAVELHATRACLVADKNSTINMKDLGAFPANWSRTSTGQLYLAAGSDYPIDTFDTSTYTSSGCLQFYPNPQDASAIDFYSLDDLVGAGKAIASVPIIPTFVQKEGILRFFRTEEVINQPMDNANVENLMQGGVVVRATQDSVVNAKNVHFPLGTNDSPLDGKYFTTSGTLCEKFMIWNIADTSRLNASHLSVSGMHPASNQYHGPSAIWASSVDGTGIGQSFDAIAYGAPKGTPDTGSLSILDTFGAGSGVWFIPSGVDVNSPFDRFYPVSGDINDETVSALNVDAGINVSGTGLYKFGAGPHASKNQGPFRIYWTPKSSARALQTDLSGYFRGGFPHGNGDFSGVVGPAYQLFAQGYNCSAGLSAIHIDDGGENIVSSVYPELLKLSYDSNGDDVYDRLHTSGFYYCSEFLEDNPTQCILDESAARTFANSQHASVGIAGTPVRVTLTRARSDDAANRLSEAYVGDASGSLGFKSASIFDLSRDN